MKETPTVIIGTDFRRARQKSITGRIALEKYFSAEEIRSLYNRGSKEVLIMLIEFMLTNPLYCIVYFFLKVYAEMIGSNRHFSDYWEIALTTKKLRYT